MNIKLITTEIKSVPFSDIPVGEAFTGSARTIVFLKIRPAYKESESGEHRPVNAVAVATGALSLWNDDSPVYHAVGTFEYALHSSPS